MPGRQSTGPATGKKSRPKNKAPRRFLNALSIAEHEVPDNIKIRKSRLGEIESEDIQKRRRDESEDASEGETRPTKLRRGDKDRYGQQIEGGSDSDGNEWMTGHVDSDDDSSLNSDDALGGSDEERFQEYAFGGSTSKKTSKKNTRKVASSISDEAGLEDEIDLDERGDDASSMSSGDESEGFAAEAVDMADIIDQRDSESEDENDGARGAKQISDGENDDGIDNSVSENAFSDMSFSDIRDEAQDPVKISALQELVTALGNGQRKGLTRDSRSAAQESAIPSEYGINPREKLTIADLLPTITDPTLRKSLRTLADDGKRGARVGNGIPQKLEVPLAKRHQDKIDRGVAYEKSKETLNRWIDTVKYNRRADHLHFPLNDPDAASARDIKKLPPTANAKPSSALESTIQNILVESGLAPTDGKSSEDQIQAFEELATNKLPVEEVQARRAALRRARELLFREDIKSKRIKKIKSKSYRRVHRKERERNAQRDQDALTAAGFEPSEDEQERRERQRAEERMGARHRESKWAKSMKGTGRAAWDEDARTGVAEMARREEELKRRIQGKDIRAEESISSGSDFSEEISDEDEEQDYSDRMINKLSKLTDDVGPKTGLSSLKFMQRADAAKKARNDEDVERIRRDIAHEGTPDDNSDYEAPGRRNYGPVQTFATLNGGRNEFEEGKGSDEDEERQNAAKSVDHNSTAMSVTSKPVHPFSTNLNSEVVRSGKTSGPADNPWLSIPKRSSSKRATAQESIMITANSELTSQRSIPQPVDSRLLASAKSDSRTKPAASDPPSAPILDQASDSDPETSFSGFDPPSKVYNPLTTNQDLIRQAFASDAVLATKTFTAEKSALAAAEAPQSAPSNSIPGWDSWVGSGVSKKSLRRDASRKLPSYSQSKPADGILAIKRKDRNTEKVIMSEKRVPKTAVYLASQLPHPYETREQYERSLRLPVGPEWTTKETFQGQTKPRVMVKGGVIAPMRKPAL